MTYPYSSLLPLPRVECSTKEYLDLVMRYGWWGPGAKVHRVKPDADYWRVIPIYTYGECPLCQVRYSEPVDTYSLGGWAGAHVLSETLYIPDRYPRRAPCPHFAGIHRFINLHDIQPTEKGYWENWTGDVPYLTPWFFPTDIPTFAVLHALPICRIEVERFVPTYTVFAVTYFSDNPTVILQRRGEFLREFGKGDPEFYGNLLAMPSLDNEEQYDLVGWAQRGKLGWLDFIEAGLPLRIGTNTVLPEVYRHIEGKRQPYSLRDGRLIVHPS